MPTITAMVISSPLGLGHTFPESRAWIGITRLARIYAPSGRSRQGDGGPAAPQGVGRPGWLGAKKTPPEGWGRERGRALTGTRWSEILEEIIRDPDTNSTARCTAIRTLLDIKPPAPSSDAWAALDEAWPPTPPGKGGPVTFLGSPTPAARRLRGLRP